MAASSGIIDLEDVLKEYPEDTPKINIPKKNIECIEYIRKFKHLERLDLSQNVVVNADHLGGCVDLKWVNISKNHIHSLGFVKNLPELSVLNAAHNEIEEIGGSVKKQKNLKALILNNNQISSAVGLHSLKFLNTLVLSHNCISEIDVSPLVSLIKLQLSHNVLKSFPNIKNNTNLKSLSLNDNEISRVPDSCLGDAKLELVDLGKNRITKFKHVSSLCAVDTLSNLNLKGCPLDQSDMYREKIMHLFPELNILDSRPVESFEDKDKSQSGDGEEEVPRKLKRKNEDSGEEEDLDVDNIQTVKMKKKRKRADSTDPEKSKIDRVTNQNSDMGEIIPAKSSREVLDDKVGDSDQKSETKIKKSKKKKTKASKAESGIVAIKDYTKKRKSNKLVVDTNSIFSPSVQIGAGMESSW